MSMNYNNLLNKNICTTLSECSYDKKHNVFMVNSRGKCINFDKLTYEYCKAINNGRYTLDSVDSLIKINCRYIYIEFKNGIIEKEDIIKIKSKLRSSLILCSILFDCSCRPTNENDEFILVYNLNKNRDEFQNKNYTHSDSISNFASKMFSLSKEEYVRFGLKDFVDLFGLKAHTFTSDQFENWANNNLRNQV